MSWVKSPTKSSLLSMIQKGGMTPKLWARFFEGVAFKNELKEYADGGEVDHTLLDNIGTKTHAQIDTHIGTTSTHFTEASIDHTAITNIGTNTHAQIDTHVGTATIHFTEGSIDHTAITNIGTTTHAQLDTHVGTANIHFTEASIDHGSITGLGDDDHALYLLASDATNRTTFATNWTDLTDSGDTIIHIHDTRYYAKDENVSIITVLADGTDAPVTISLPDATTLFGYIYNIKAIDATNTITISAYGTQEIDGSTDDITLSAMESISIQSDESNWWII